MQWARRADRSHRWWASAAVLLSLAGCATPPPDAGTLMRQAEQALGSAGLQTLEVTGHGSGAAFGQAYVPGGAWPALNYSKLTRAMNFATGAFREEYTRSRAEPTGGGATPPLGQGEARATGFARDGYAWNATAGGMAPAPVSLPARIHDLWTTTPQGALIAAQRLDAVAGTRTLDGKPTRTLSYTAAGQYQATLLLDAAGLVTRIESKLPNPVLGDVPVVTEFSDWRIVPGGNGKLNFPMHIRQSQGGFPVLDISVDSVSPGAAVAIDVPDNVRHARENVSVEPVAAGVWFIAGGSHHSVAIEMAQQIVLVESPLDDGRAAAVIAAANGLVAGKKVRTVIATHHHFDHAGGLRAAVAEGAELITSEAAKPWYDAAFANPNRIAPDRLALAGRTARITGIGGSTALRDATRPVEVHFIEESPHAQGFLMVWLPREKLLIEADAWTPGPPGSTPPAVINPLQLNLVQNIERLQIRPDRILALHGRIATLAELYAQVGRRP